MDSLDWNDLRFVVAVARSGSAAAAARVLGVSHATVLRRIQSLEQGVGTPLFDRLSSGYVPTEAGRRLADMGASIESALLNTTRVIEGETSDLAGTIRFTTTDSLAYFIVPPVLASFRERYPAIQVELIVTNQRLDLDKREADVTLRPSANPPDSWVGMRLGRFGFGVYAAKEYLARRKGVMWEELDWIAPSGNLAGGRASQWVREKVGDVHPAATVDSFTGLRMLALGGMGAAMLPHFMAEGEERLQLLRPLPEETGTDLWVLTHPNLRQSGRIHAFMEHLAQEVRKKLSS